MVLESHCQKINHSIQAIYTQNNMEDQHDQIHKQKATLHSNATLHSKSNELPNSPIIYSNSVPEKDATHSNSCAETSRLLHPKLLHFNSCTLDTEESNSVLRSTTVTNPHDIRDYFIDMSQHHQHETKYRNTLVTGGQRVDTLNYEQRVDSFCPGHFDPVNLKSTNPVTSVSKDVSHLNWLWPCVVVVLTVALVHAHLRVSRLESVMDELEMTMGECKQEALHIQSGTIINKANDKRDIWPTKGIKVNGLAHSWDKNTSAKEKTGHSEDLNTAVSTDIVSQNNAVDQMVTATDVSEIKTQLYFSRNRLNTSETFKTLKTLYFLDKTRANHLHTLHSVIDKDSNTELDAEAPQIALENLKQKFGNVGDGQTRRSKRSAESKKIMFDQYCKDKWQPRCDKDKYLSSAQFAAEFYKIYDFNKDFINRGADCFQDDQWPTKPKVCKEATVEYPDEDSPVALYQIHDNSEGKNESKRGNKKRNIISKTDDRHGVFTVKESGVYLVHLNITIVDDSHNHSLAIFLNKQAVLACPKGGFRCPHSNEPKSYKYRICNIDGVLELNKGDSLQVRTLEPKTVIRLEQHRKSLLKFILLYSKKNRKG